MKLTSDKILASALLLLAIVLTCIGVYCLLHPTQNQLSAIIGPCSAIGAFIFALNAVHLMIIENRTKKSTYE